MAKHDILFISAITPLHNGSGTGSGLIDNPILRERHTQFPYVQSPSIKGVLRDAFGKDSDAVVQALFGPPPGQGDSHGGAVSFTDAQIFAFPVRSLKGGFVWATCPHVLHRLWRVVTLAGLDAVFPKLQALISGVKSTFNNNTSGIMVSPTGKPCLLVEKSVILEEYAKILVENDALDACLEACAIELSGYLFHAVDTFLKAEFSAKLVVLPDDSFRYFVVNATEIIPNISIGPNGTTVTGSLRYTEFLPAESILFSFITHERAKIPKDKNMAIEFTKIGVAAGKQNLTDPGNGAEAVQALFALKLGSKAILQSGGDETSGKGQVQLKLVNGGSHV